MTDEHHDTVVVDGDRSSGMGAVIGIIAIIVLLVAVWYIALGPGSGGTTTYNNTTNNGVNLPAVSAPAPGGS